MLPGASFSGFQSLMDGLEGGVLLSLALTIVPVWLFGIFAGLLLPRPKWMSGGTNGALLLTTPPGTGFRRLAVAFHGAVVLRELWRCFSSPGTFRAFMFALWRWLTGNGWQSPEKAERGARRAVMEEKDDWYVTAKDLEFFKYRVEQDGAVQGAGNWEKMCDREIDGKLKYVAYRRKVPGGRTEYKSVSLSIDSTAEENMDFYLDDKVRQAWDSMLSHTEVVETGEFDIRASVVRWLRSFPFGFLTDREYIIARRTFRSSEALYGITKGVEHPECPAGSRIVRCPNYYSMWRCKNIECPWGTGATACETILLHYEDMSIPEGLARFAVKCGMWGFVKRMGPAAGVFCAKRRARGLAPHARDAAAFGANHRGRRTSIDSMSSTSSCGESCSSSAVGSRQSGRLQRVASAVVLGSMAALAVNRSKSAALATKAELRRAAASSGLTRRAVPSASGAGLARRGSAPPGASGSVASGSGAAGSGSGSGTRARAGYPRSKSSMSMAARAPSRAESSVAASSPRPAAVDAS